MSHHLSNSNPRNDTSPYCKFYAHCSVHAKLSINKIIGHNQELGAHLHTKVYKINNNKSKNKLKLQEHLY